MIAAVFFQSPSGRAADHAVILQYHHFGSNTPPVTSVTVRQFENHLAYLEKNGFAVWPLEKIISRLKSGQPVPDRCVAITMDDAYVSIYEKAYPRLKEYGWPFTIFVSTQAVDKGYKSHLTWDQIREMSQNGAHIAGHSHSHDHLPIQGENETAAQWRVRVTEDIRTAMARIQSETGMTTSFFAYPYGEYSLRLKQIVEKMGLTGLGQQSGPVWRGSDFGVVPRFAMAAGYAQMDEFVLKVNSLPLPVISASLEEPVITGEDKIPALRLTLAPGAYDPKTLACFLSGQGQIPVLWIDPEKRVLEISGNIPLPEGRSRYNCTAKQQSGSGYYWYSHLWIRYSK